MRIRNWSIRAKIIALLLVPLVTLIVLWGMSLSVTITPTLDLLSAQSNLDNVGTPSGVLLASLQEERKLSVVFLGDGRTRPQSLAAQRAETDAAVRNLRQLASDDNLDNSQSELTRQRLAALYTAVDTIVRGRETIDRGELDRNGTIRLYNGVIDVLFQIYQSLPGVADADLNRQSRAIITFTQARELLAQEDTLVSGANAAGKLSSAEYTQLVQTIGTRRFLTAAAVADLAQLDLDRYTQVTAQPFFTQLRANEDLLISAGRPGAAPPVTSESWQKAYDLAAADLRQFELDAADNLIERSKPMAIRIIANLVIASLLGLVAMALTTITSLRLGRGLIRELANLRDSARELADERLPSVVARLRRGESVDIAREAPDIPHTDDEIGRVGAAFNQVRQTAIQAAIDEAHLRQGLNEVFLNIARRSQTLLHRQLSVLDRMERRTVSPNELADLFRVDHLATRMRRHAEDLVILAGATPGRGWRSPVPVVDVLRGAVSEVEDYARVSVLPVPEVAIVGRAVGDVIHLLAELIENATTFSPPHVHVTIGGTLVANGFAVEIEDRGLGMSTSALAEANLRLTQPPDFDPATSAQLGLFVVARLAARHGVKVELSPSPYGGITAVVLLPAALIADVLPTSIATAARERDANLRPALVAAGQPRHARADPAMTSGPPATAGPDTRAETPPRPLTGRRSAETTAPTGPTDGLPRRVRQANLAEQLRTDEPTTGDIITTDTPARSPEQMRSMMSAFQAGTAKGRRAADDVDHADGAAASGATPANAGAPASGSASIDDGASAITERET